MASLYYAFISPGRAAQRRPPDRESTDNRRSRNFLSGSWEPIYLTLWGKYSCRNLLLLLRFLLLLQLFRDAFNIFCGRDKRRY